MKTALITEIKENSLDDGPGIRTVVFFKGCPLSCQWCHNPETIKPKPELAFHADDCIGLTDCIKTCPQNALHPSNEGFVNRELCDCCFDCIDSCESEALKQVGKQITVREIVEILQRYLPFYQNSGGGLTLSGGECMLYPEFCSELLKSAQSLSIDTLVETCGYFGYEQFQEKIGPHVNRVYYDLKLWDDALHLEYCGKSNQRILDNFKRLVANNHDSQLEILPRIPLIPGITTNDHNLKALADFLNQTGIKTVSLLPYNPLWPEKAERLGYTTTFQSPKSMTQDAIAYCKSFFKEFTIV